MSNYHIYGQEDCNFCQQAATLLSDNALDWVMEYVNDDVPHIRTLLNQAGLTTVPQIYGPSGGYIGGFEQLQAALAPPTEETPE